MITSCFQLLSPPKLYVKEKPTFLRLYRYVLVHVHVSLPRKRRSESGAPGMLLHLLPFQSYFMRHLPVRLWPWRSLISPFLIQEKEGTFGPGRKT